MSSGRIASVAEINALRDVLARGGVPDDTDDLVAVIAALEELKSAACAMQAESAVALDATRRSEQAAEGVAEERRGRGVASEVALARRESPHRGQVLLGFAKVLHDEMPRTRQRLADGTLNEWRAMLLVRETACLTADQRAFVDEELCADPATLDGLGTRALVKRVKALSYELDPAAVARRASRAEEDRCVTVRPAPDTMSYLTGHLPVAQGVAVYAALGQQADTLRASGDVRRRSQLMADLLVSRVTGSELPAPEGEGRATPPPAVPVSINVTMSDETLVAGGHRPAEVGADGVTPEMLPAETARLLISRALRAEVATWIRSLYVDPGGRLVAMTSRQRLFTEGLGDFLAQRDVGICRSPYCDAPIRHRDHVVAVRDGGATSADNGQGLCESCNHAKQATGWSQEVVDRPGGRHLVETVTPSGHRYRSEAPPPVGWREPRWVRTRPGVFTLVA